MGRGHLKFWRWFLQQKWYFDKGFGIMSYVKYIIVAIGLTFKDFYLTAIIGVFTAIIFYIVGFVWAKYKLADVENDINNQYNPFVSSTLRLLRKNKKFK